MLTNIQSYHTHQLVEVKGGSEEDFTHAVESFKKNKGIHMVLAFSGGADDDDETAKRLLDKFKLEKALFGVSEKELEDLAKEAQHEYLEGKIRGILGPLPRKRIAILAGGTTWGVPSIATEIAKELGFRTIGVFPQIARLKGDMLPEELLDLAICVHPMIGTSQWGDEAPIFTKLLDAVIIIGGGAGTMVEVAHLLKLNEPHTKKGKVVKSKIKHLIPMSGTGGTADRVAFFPGKSWTMAECTPPKPILTVEEALGYLKDKTQIMDLYEEYDVIQEEN